MTTTSKFACCRRGHRRKATVPASLVRKYEDAQDKGPRAVSRKA